MCHPHTSFTAMAAQPAIIPAPRSYAKKATNNTNAKSCTNGCVAPLPTSTSHLSAGDISAIVHTYLYKESSSSYTSRNTSYTSTNTFHVIYWYNMPK